MHPFAIRRAVTLFAALALLIPASAAAKAHPNKAPRHYAIGMASRSVALEANGSFAGQPVYLGGYGLSSGRPADTINGEPSPAPHPADYGVAYTGARKPANGNLDGGPSVHAAVISAGKGSFAMADIENQGCFTQNKQGFGVVSMRELVAAKTHGALPADRVDIQCDHSHGGPDLIGVWGGVPTEYLKFVQDQTVAAIVDAFENQVPADLYYGTAQSGVEGRTGGPPEDKDPLL